MYCDKFDGPFWSNRFDNPADHPGAYAYVHGKPRSGHAYPALPERPVETAVEFAARASSIADQFMRMIKSPAPGC
jgi:hypothetical protein